MQQAARYVLAILTDLCFSEIDFDPAPVRLWKLSYFLKFVLKCRTENPVI